MAESGEPTQTDKGWGIDWGSPETWRRLAFGTVMLFIIVTITPLLVGGVLAYSLPTNTTDVMIHIYIPLLSVLIVTLLINRANTDRGAGQTGFVSAGGNSQASSGSMRDRIWFYSWSLVFCGLAWLAYRWAYGFFYPDYTYLASISSVLVLAILSPRPQLFALLFGPTPVDPEKVT